MKISPLQNYYLTKIGISNSNNTNNCDDNKYEYNFAKTTYPCKTNIINFTSNIKNLGLPAKNYNLNDKTILITGATGTLGNAIISELLKNYSAKQIIVFSRDEYKQYKMKQSLPKSTPITFIIGDVRDEKALKKALKGVDVVIHTAAMKHVAICEENKEEAIKTNFFGTLNAINASMDSDVERFILISTDKAANPSNLYGHSKKWAENLINNANKKTQDDKNFSIIRMGNILGSRGSVLPLFQEQKKKGELTVTDENMTRFFITPTQAAKQVLSSIEIMRGGEIFIPKLKSAKIVDLAKQSAPDCKIKIIGAKKGEKIHEDLIDKKEQGKIFELIDRYVILPDKKSIENASKLNENIKISSNEKKYMFSLNELNEIIQECLIKS